MHPAYEKADHLSGEVIEAAEMCQRHFFKIINKKLLARLNSGLACGVVAGIGLVPP
jgi:hypothetical protein